MLAKTRGDWILCPICGHKLGKMISGEVANGPARGPAFETKCHSCKNIILIRLCGEKKA